METTITVKQSNILK